MGCGGISRRSILSSAAALGATPTLGESSASQQQSNDEILFRETFDGPEGSLPTGWIPVGNLNQAIEREDGRSAYRMSGDPGGCWEALADTEIPIPNNGAIRISMTVKPTSNGRPGCHDHRTSAALRTATGTWDAGNGVPLFRFFRGGFFSEANAKGVQDTNLGGYTVGEWNEVEVTYERTEDEVTQRYWINGDHRGTVVREPTDYEERLSFLRIGSGDFTVLWNEITVDRIDPKQLQDDTGGGWSLNLWDSISNIVMLVVALFLIFAGIGAAVDEEASDGSEESPGKPNPNNPQGKVPHQERTTNYLNQSDVSEVETDEYGQLKRD